MNQTEVSEKLHRLYDLNEMIKADCVRLNTIANMRSPSFDNIGGSNMRNPLAESIVERNAMRTIEIEEEIESMLKERDGLEAEAKDMFKCLSPKSKIVMELRYLDGMSWMEIASALFGMKKDFEDRKDSYRHVVTTRHGNALTKIASCR